MKTITLTQPYATLVALGKKRIETRSWSTSHRGDLVIHAALRFPLWARQLMKIEPFSSSLAGYQIKDLPRGAVVAICQLADCLRIEADQIPPEPERSFGVYTPGRWAWCLEDIKPLTEPVPVKGRLGLWNWDIPVDAIIKIRE